VVDSGCPDFFGGEPTVTALGIGPATKEQVQHITGRFCLLP
jgi:peptidyl-tRNA hydrolase